MVNGIYLSTAGMLPKITQIDNVSNNLANVSTNGYKKSNMFLRELITSQQALDHALGNERTEEPEEVWIDYTQGTFDETGELYDLALNGPGFFRVQDDTGAVFYTRNGRFHTDPNGVLMTDDGKNVLDEMYRPILIDGNNVVIQGNGEILVDGEVETSVGIADFQNADYPALTYIGQGLFQKPANINESVSSVDTKVLQGYLEDANVDAVHSMVDMIEIFRAYELGQKAIQMQDQSLQRVVTEVGAVR